MKELSSEEEHWLVVFAKYNPFFDDLLKYYLKNDSLSEKQYESLEKEIEIAEEDGKRILDIIDFRFLKEHAEENEDLRKICDVYEEDGFLDESDFNAFIDIKLELNPDFKKGEKLASKSENELQRKKKYEEGTPNNYVAKEINLEKILEFLNEEFLAKSFISKHLTYVLKLENDKWWIGKTNFILRTIEDFKRGKGSKWIIDNPLLSIEKLVFDIDPASLTLEYMKKYGWENVQGSSWYENQLNKYTPVKILNYVNEQRKIKPNQDIPVEVDRNYLVCVLKLKNDKWWVGKTTNIKRTLKKIRSGNGSPWTVINPLIKLEELREHSDLKEVTLEYMRKYGWENVRGYAWSQWNMKNPPKELKLK